MALDMEWSPAFCLACDRQTDGKVYCSESCRLAEYESASTASSAASSPTSTRAPLSWPGKQSSKAFALEPAYNFANAQPYGGTPAPRASLASFPHPARAAPAAPAAKGTLTPSSSQSSLFSMQSSHSATSAEPIPLSHESRKALRAYASSFDHSRYSRRQSAH
ncbi:hypothetical protein QTJ16_004974 [Diplocarpon rosae]|uniref:Uncharacterized protein n=1 Tax=Diplocarpon rosae TaxID=946125 RepID=A0AAD9SY38_9HELO|nr:hypothetical protein QTJ16_004974 [Diplocarpon rosae]PBP21299.1 hypothetical protein BUE80_DR007882 [Diplocarpon rosae]